ncbi:MAG: hypothetical protein HY748_08950 [Elusimicrobia bacterium]|nr:hypothetical protein [Elusimicrobiota bacterium]
MRPSLRSEAPPLSMLVIIGILILAPHVPHAGLHLDDHGFHWHLSRADFAAAWRNALAYIPGRNLYILYYWAFYKALGPFPERLHLLGMALDILNGCLAYVLLRRAAAGRAAALLCAGLFLVWPNHAETHFWTASVGMNLLSTTFILLTFLTAGDARIAPGLRFALAVTLFGLALFDYDQAFFMWIPLAFYLGSLAEKPPAGWRLGLAGACALLSCGHFLIRTFSPHVSGSPVVRPGAVALRAAQSLAVSAVPMTKLPVWEALQSFSGGPVPTVALTLALTGGWLFLIHGLWSAEDAEPSPRLAVLGGLWFAAAYLPNYFWYISPRHNYLPSLGFIMASFYLASRLVSRIPFLRPALAGLAFLIFGLSSAATLAEGYGWASAAALHSQFAGEAPRLLPDPPDNIFLVGAPRTFLRAPAFSLTDEHLFLYAYATGHLPAAGDIMLTPTRTGAFYRNQPEVYGPDSLHWRSYRGMRVLTRSVAEGGFLRLKGLRVEPPGLPQARIGLCEEPACRDGELDSRQGAVPDGLGTGVAGRDSVGLDARVWLVKALALPPANKPAVFQASNGVSLIAASGRRGDGWFDLDLHWLADRRPAADFASVVRLYDGAGRPAFEPVHPVLPGLVRRLGRFPAALWPAYNDLKPASGWKAGSVVAERYRLATTKPLPAGPLELRLTLFEKTQTGPWKRLGEFKAGKL